MMLSTYVRMAVRSLRSARWRSFLTMLGVVVGVASVVTIVSIGEGVKQQIIRQVATAGAEVITIRPGQLVERDDHGRVKTVHYQGIVTAGSLTDTDLTAVRQTKGLANVVPFGLLSGVPETEDNKVNDAVIIGTSADMPSVLNRKIAYGSFFSSLDANTPAAVIGPKLAETLFKENAPIGSSFTLRGQEVIVRGVMERVPPGPQDLGINYDNAIFLPYDFAKKVAGGQLQVYQILIRPLPSADVTTVVSTLTENLKKAHGGQADFTVLQAADNLAIASNALNLMTALVAAMAGISLIVGGVGIMNIMLVAVSERTHEIGVRKSVGATNRQIRVQFLIEAVVISATGGVFGIIGSLIANYLLRLFTSLEPAFDPLLMFEALVGAVALGTLFGLAPAVKAARKDPIAALRRFN